MVRFIIKYFLFLSGIAVLACQSSPEQAQSSPNILFCIADDASFPHMSAYGCDWVNTPGFDRVAQEGLLFTNAYTPNAKCAPSRACILTGRNSWQLEEAANHIAYFPAKFTTYAEALVNHGYHVGYTAKGWAPGVPGERNGEPRQLTGLPYNEHQSTPPTPQMNDNDYAANFAAFLEARPAGKPFCFWYGSTEPHRGYAFGSGMAQGDKTPGDITQVPAFWPDNDSVRTDMLDYAFELEYFDQHLQQMLAILEERGELDNTLVVVTADNGMPFPRAKGQAYEYSNHLPLAMMWKEGIAQPGRTIDELISFIDFAPTFLEVAGLDTSQSSMQPIQGRSLTNLFGAESTADTTAVRDHLLIGKERHDVGRPKDQGYPIRGIVRDGMLYIRNYEPSRWPSGNPETGYLNTDGSPTKTVILSTRGDATQQQYWEWNFGKRPEEELYQISSDPDCLRNLANQPEYQGIKNQLADQMTAELKAQGDPRVFGKGYLFDEYEYTDPKTKNFYERFIRGDSVEASWVNNTDFANR